MTRQDFPIIGIGASAGGVEALSAFFKRMPAQPGAAFVVVTHLARDRDSMLPEIIGRFTAMPVAHAESGDLVKPDRVYLLPPDRFLRLAGDRLMLEERAGQHNPIDVFFVSLAAETGERAVAVVLSGTGTDGAIGIKAVRGAGGFTLAQSEDNSAPAYPDMPNAAIATGFVDCALPIDAIPDRLGAYVREYSEVRQGRGLGSPEQVKELKGKLCGLLHKRTGQVIPLFHYALRSGGFLFLGSSENLAQHGELFTPLDKKERVFRRRDLPGHRPHIFPLLLKAGLQRSNRDDAGPPSGRSQFARVEGRVLEKFAPAHVVINREWDVVHFSARIGKYLEPPMGAPSRNVLEMARPGLRLVLRSALHEAVELGHTIECGGVMLELDSGVQMVDITVEPLFEISAEPLWLVVFSDVGAVRSPEDGAASENPPGNHTEVAHLERELQQTRERLQTTIEEYETSVEELKSANEELLSVNEELQSTNEELETSKEELQAVNSELAAKVDELDRANNDLKNLFDSTRIATIFLDSDLVVRSFTPAVSEIFKLIPSDRGRSLSDFATFIDYDDLTADVRHAIATAEPVEKSVSRSDGTAHYLMRILPYRRSDTSVDGVVITFVNVTDMVDAEEHQRLLIAELNHRVKNVLAVVSSLASQMAKRTDNLPAFVDGFLSRIQGLATTHEVLAAKEWSTISLGELITAEISAFIDSATRARISGPDVRLHPRAATTMGIAIHELATNALKYGALTNDHGRVAVTWRAEESGGAKQLALTWREVDGPPVVPPKRKGLGSELIERGLDYELGGKAVVEFLPDGLVATLSMPFSEHISEPLDEKALPYG